MAQTPNYGFVLPREGGMVFGKDLTSILTDIDAKLYEALHTDLVQAEGIVTSVNWGAMSADWVNVLLMDSGDQLKFAGAANLISFRVLVPSSGAPTSGTCDIAIALASAPTTPLTGVITVPTGGIDGIGSPLVVPTAIAATEELVLIANGTATPAGTGGTVQIVVEGNASA